ncbi:hypothetical protein [Rubinisphaera italica]|uniref:Uncharacterized protein n=1 Tax=Rubinisphaera italica TaxID=2527969 RepID=A0A5C5XB20_9PLAN|nr:hypothetical protein [Rubinisphaera italica]TWT59385.1 hypothetical protein Pan54_00860 [Rubinisphaera italica]
MNATPDISIPILVILGNVVMGVIYAGIYFSLKSSGIGARIVKMIAGILLLMTLFAFPVMFYMVSFQSPPSVQMSSTATYDTNHTMQIGQPSQPREVTNQPYREGAIQLYEKAIAELHEQSVQQVSPDEDRSERTRKLRQQLEAKLEELKHPEQNYPRWIKEAGPQALAQLEHPGVQRIPTFHQQMIVSSARWVTRQEAHQEAIDQAKQAIFEQISSPGETPEISIEQLNSFILDEYIEDYQLNLKDSSIQADMYRCHLLLDLSPAQLATLMPDIRKSALEKRLAIAGGALLSIMTFAGLASFVIGRK